MFKKGRKGKTALGILGLLLMLAPGWVLAKDIPPKVKLTSPANHAVFAAPAAIMLLAEASDKDGTIKRVQFFSGSKKLATVTSAPYTFTWTNVQKGKYTLTAVATDNRGAKTTSHKVHIIVDITPMVSLKSPANNAVFIAPATIHLMASAKDPDGRIAKVEFFEGANLLAAITVRPYTFTLNGVQAGTYSFTARATDNQGLVTTSSAVNITVTSGAAQLYFIYTDQLNTPRVITDQTNKVVWRWDNNDPFGANVPDEDPSNTGTKFTCNLRLPGQYFDRETSTNYNYFRDYDPNTGRYIQSDPVGLDGGINTYMYVLGSPLTKRDFFGLDTCGSGFLEGLVSDNPFLFPFSSCCRYHDNCYDNCFSQPTKSECDDRFCGCMKSRCQKYSHVRGFCEWTAQVYCDAVVSKGQPAFEDARKKCKGAGCQR